MHVGLNLTPEEFSQLHNLLCKLGNLGPEADKLVDKIRGTVLKPAYEADSAMFDKLYKLYSDAGKKFGAETTWSMYEVKSMGRLHPFEGAKTVTHQSHWGEKIPVIEIKGDTWLDLYKAADAAIKESGDMHHTFIEGFNHTGDTLVLMTGS